MRYTTRFRGASLVALMAGLAGTSALAQGPSVVAEMPVTHSLVSMVMGDLGAPTLLLDRGADPHDFALRPSQARAVAEADLVVWMGPDMTPWMSRTVASLARGSELQLLEVPGLTLQAFLPSRLTGAAAEFAAEHVHDHSGHGHDDHGHEHGHDHDHDHDDHDHDDHDDHDHDHDHDDHAHDDHDHDDHGHDHDDHGHSHSAHADDDHDHDHDHDHDDHSHDDHGHDHDDHAHDDHGHAHDDHGHDDHAHEGHGGHAHGSVDPHAWLDPQNAKAFLAAIAESLAGIDPENAAVYRANATASAARLDALEAEIAALLAPVADAGLVVYHDAYGYMATRFGLNILGSITLGDASAPGAARLREISASLQSVGAVCAFPEVNHSDAFLTLTTTDTALRIGAPLDPAGTLLEPGAGLYDALMRDLAGAIVECVTAG
jgi:zinc transport system substrate-binding protein